MKTVICKIENCDRDVRAKELCHRHYCFYIQRKIRGIPLDWPFGKIYHKKVIKPKEKKPCKVKGCEKISKVRKYCPFHYARLRHGVPLNRPKGIKGELNPRWNGGIAYYSDHRTMKKNRLVKIEQENNKCEICKHKAKQVHHIDKDKSNHSLENLKLLCVECHKRFHRGQKAKTSIWIRRYGMTIKKLCIKLKCSYPTLLNWHKNGDIAYFLGK